MYYGIVQVVNCVQGSFNPGFGDVWFEFLGSLLISEKFFSG